MIKYLLKCADKHEFESWFSNSKEYEKLKKRKLIECIFCKSIEVEKSIMSPYVGGKKKTKTTIHLKVKNLLKLKKKYKKYTNLSKKILSLWEKNFQKK